MGRSKRDEEHGGGGKKRSSRSGDGAKRRAGTQDNGNDTGVLAAEGAEGGRVAPPTTTAAAVVVVAEALPAAADSHDSDAPTAQHDGAAAAGVINGETASARPAVYADQAALAGGGAPATRKRAGKAAPVLPWMRVPVAIEAFEGTLLEEVRGLDPRLRQALEGTGVEVLFPVQTAVWRETAGGTSAAHDVCICAPTGSGKTLAYALPVLQALGGCVLPHLRALVVLPTRDLAAQVFGVLAALGPALGLTACLVAGKASLVAEAELLACGGIDILVATPGRLIAHLEGTPGFTLSHLRFLVVDETDRLLRQAYQGWLPKVVAALQAGSGGCGAVDDAVGTATSPQQQQQQQQEQQQDQGQVEGQRVVKFVVSATLTQDPSKINRLALHCPRYIAMNAMDHRYKLPRSLRELKLVVAAERKPAALAALLQELRGEQTIVFTSSVEATHRLYLLLAALTCLPEPAVEFSSLVAPVERAAHLEAFRSGQAKVLVCSDAMTRGMDVEGVHNVVNYDLPVYVKTYVHRAGRTARAGRSGRVFTLLRHEDVRHFKDMLRKVDNTFVQDHRLGKGALEAVRDEVDAALERMAAALLAEGEVAELGLQRGAGDAVAAGFVAAAAAAPATATDGKATGDKQQRQQKNSSNVVPKRRKVAGVPEFSLLTTSPP